jgi:hypothetical protein
VPTFTIAGESFDLEHETVERAVDGVLPDPVREHYVVVGGRRFPPKQVIADATGLDRADFTTHQARRVLKRLGFAAARVGRENETGEVDRGVGPYGGRQAAALGPFIGKWVALETPTSVLVAADSPEDVLAWLAKHERKASYGMFRVPRTAAEAEGTGPW